MDAGGLRPGIERKHMAGWERHGSEGTSEQGWGAGSGGGGEERSAKGAGPGRAWTERRDAGQGSQRGWEEVRGALARGRERNASNGLWVGAAAAGGARAAAAPLLLVNSAQRWAVGRSARQERQRGGSEDGESAKKGRRAACYNTVCDRRLEEAVVQELQDFRPTAGASAALQRLSMSVIRGRVHRRGRPRPGGRPRRPLPLPPPPPLAGADAPPFGRMPCSPGGSPPRGGIAAAIAAAMAGVSPKGGPNSPLAPAAPADPPPLPPCLPPGGPTTAAMAAMCACAICAAMDCAAI